MATIKAILKKKNSTTYQTNKLGQALVYIQYGHQGKKVLFSTEVHLDPRHWNGDKDQNKLIKSSLNGYSTKTSLIHKLKYKIDDAVVRLMHEDIAPTIERIKEEISGSSDKNKAKKSTIVELFENYVEDQKLQKKAKNTIKGYNTFLNHLKNYTAQRKDKVTIDKVDFQFSQDLKAYFLSTVNLNTNSTQGQMKTFKGFLTSLKTKEIALNIDPFDIKIKWEQKRIIFLTQDEIDQLYRIPMPNIELDQVRDLFVFVACTGFRISDLERISKHHLHNHAIELTAFKNKKATFVPIIPRAEEILEKYNYRLPSFVGQTYNRRIKKACEAAGINNKIDLFDTHGGNKDIEIVEKYTKVSSHVAVSTYITHALQKKIAVKDVSTITGKSVKTIMQHYAGIDKNHIRESVQDAFR